MKNSIIEILFFIYMLIISIGSVKDFTKSNKLFIIKKIMDSVVYVFSFVIIVISNNFLCKNAVNRVNNFIVIIFFVCNLVFIFKQIKSFDKNKDLNYDMVFLFTLISLLIGIIICFSSIYYILYYYNSAWFIVDGKFGVARLAFEFIYYTFSITITYSSTTITAIGVVPKIVQMIHILIFYFFAGDMIISLISKKNK